ncbi:MAG: hydrogenase maturation nickel metallochaperone HypA [Bacteroidales bacterium]|nr:hydrogenase maturation nickel metallochaperone HypA [Bacteroidales bacterium]
MHELSLAMEVVDLALNELNTKQLKSVLELEVEVGDLSGVEYETFQTAMEMAVKGTLMENTTVILNRVHGLGKCSNCGEEFKMEHRVSLCPVCKGFPGEILSGTEFRIVSLLVE